MALNNDLFFQLVNGMIFTYLDFKSVYLTNGYQILTLLSAVKLLRNEISVD